MENRGLLGHENAPYDIMMTYACHYTFLQTYRMYNSNHKMCRLWVISCVNVGSLIVTNVPLWLGILTMGKATPMWG